MDTYSNTPKKYIRTLAGDIAILKSGGTPDLVPLAESEVPIPSPSVAEDAVPTPPERLVAASPIVPIPVPVPPEPKQSLIPQPRQPVPPGPSPIKTYASDFFNRIKNVHASTATVLAAEQDAAPQEHESVPDTPRTNFTYIIAGAVLIIVSGLGVYFAYTRYFVPLEPIILAPIASAPIFVDDREQISGKGTILLRAIEQSVGRKLAPGAVRLLFTTDATTTDNVIFATLKIPAPDIVLRNINASGSMTGVVNTAGNQSPFFIFSVTSYSGSFSGMLSWEYQMPRDLNAFFPSYPTPVPTPVPNIATTTLTSATTTSPLADSGLRSASTTPKIPAFIAGFHDEVVSNHDVRIYRDAKNRSILLYGYWNQKTLIIARDQAAFTEILRRLATSRTQ